MMLLVRNALGSWVSQKEISDLHIERFRTFSLSDLVLPYSCMFERNSSMFERNQFVRNREDLALVIGNSTRARPFLEDLSLLQIIILEWLFKTNLADRAGGDIRNFLSSRLTNQPRGSDEFAAAKSLLVRHGWRPMASDPSFLTTLGLGTELAELVASVDAARNEIQPLAPARRSLGLRLFHNRGWQGLQVIKLLAAKRVPFIRRRRRKPRAAICISGQLRGYEATFPTWKQTLLPLLEYDIFVHSWTRIGRSGAEPWRYELPFEGAVFTERYREICREIGFEAVKERYPSFFKGISETSWTSESALATFYGSDNVRLDDESQAPFTDWSNQDKMHAKIEACFSLVADSGREYDLILRIRPDKPIKLVAFDPWQLRRICHERPVLFADYAADLNYANPMIGDQFAIGAPRPMQIYSSTRTIYPKLALNGLLKCPHALRGHVSLAQVCWTHGISVERAPIRFDKLQEPAAIPRNMIRKLLDQDARNRRDAIDRLLIDATAADSHAQN